MQLKTIILVMTIMLLTSVTVGSYYFYYVWNINVEHSIREHSHSEIKSLYIEVNTYIKNKRKPARTLANIPAIKSVLLKNSFNNLQHANRILDIFCSTLDALTCYLMNEKGTTIASSNRFTIKSFVGKNYAFRPYFKKAISGVPSVYLALGITSKKRGVYFSHPVVVGKQTLGVAVIKVAVDGLEKQLSKTWDIVTLTSPDGVVFASSRADWLFKTLWKLPKDKLQQLAKSRQFGDQLPHSVDLQMNQQGVITDNDGNTYIMSKQEVLDMPGWWISHFHNTRLTADHQTNKLNKMISYAALFLFLFISAITLLLYRFATNEIKVRKQVENDLLKAKEEAVQANKAKSRFLSHMSHELRTPMNAILGFGQLLVMDTKELSESQQTNINEILDAGNHLLSLINEALDLAKIESGKLDIFMWDVNVDEIMQRSISLIQPQLIKQKIQLHNHIKGKGYVVRADETRFKQVLVNLLSNAVKYNRENGCITLDSEITEGKYLCIRITDTGQGLTEQEITKLFTSFERLNKDDKIEGAGIGLVITKNLVELMGGEIGVSSIPGKGSTFWIKFILVKNSG